jgi:23S rRNA-/tRNA-specific pseudouridylate synthase
MQSSPWGEVGDPWQPAALNQGWTYRDRVDSWQQGLTALAFYSTHYSHSAAEIWRLRLEAGEIERAGVPLGPQDRLAKGDRLSWRRPPWREEAVPLPGPPLWDDGDLLVLDKPSGLPVLPAGGWLEHTLLRLLERRHRQDPAGIPRPVHRLGRFTSGLLVCARQPATRAWLSRQLRESTAAGWPAAAEGDPGSPAVAHRNLSDPARIVAATPPLLADPSGGEQLAELQGRPAATAGASQPRRGSPVGGGNGAMAAARGGTLPCGSGAASRAGLSAQPQSGRRTESVADAALDRPGEIHSQLGPGCCKLYRALLAPGALPLEPGASLTVRTPIGRRPHPRLGRVWCASAAGAHGALAACSRLTLLARSPQADLVAVAIASGRPHQIRIHCAALGAPLLGDPLYLPGGQADPRALPGDGGYRLQAWRLELTLPTGERLALEVERPLRIV